MTVEIDPDGVLAMAASTLGVGTTLGAIGGDISTTMEQVDHLVPAPPNARSRTSTMAETLALLAGAARSHAVQYVDHELPLRELRERGYWLPNFGNLFPNGNETVAQNLARITRSDEFGALPLGISAALLERYRNFRVEVPKVDNIAARTLLSELDDLLATSDDVVSGTPVIRRPSGLLVPQGSSGDPRVPRMLSIADDATYRPGPTLVTDPALGRPPTWARTGSKALGVIGVGLTLWDVGASQWEHDQKYHPEWSTTERVASTAFALGTEGSGAVAGGIVGAQWGATLGSFVPIPVVGTVGGALIGGAIGAFVGSKAGKAAGTLLKEGINVIGEGISDAWNGLFG